MNTSLHADSSPANAFATAFQPSAPTTTTSLANGHAAGRGGRAPAVHVAALVDATSVALVLACSSLASLSSSTPSSCATRSTQAAGIVVKNNAAHANRFMP